MIVADNREVGSTLIAQIIGLIVGEKIGAQCDASQKEYYIETRHRDVISFEFAPDNGAERFALSTCFDCINHGASPGKKTLLGEDQLRRPKAMRGSTTASKRSDSKIPSRVNSALTVKSAITTGKSRAKTAS